jgi:peptidoglycan/LPS O-acetylase OafA/YrhL
MNRPPQTTLAPAPAHVPEPVRPPARAHVTPPPARRLLVIDALRALAAISVLLHHLPPFTGPFIVLRPWQAIGFVGVGLFLVLSGFSIHYKWAATRIGGEFDQRVFWRRRFFRLVPSYWVAAAISLAAALAIGALVQPVAPWGGGEELVPWALAWASQIVVVTANFIPVPVLFVTWTIALELQLYAAYAAVVHFVRRFDPLKIVFWALFVTLAWRFGSQLVVTSIPAGGFLPDGHSPLESRILYSQMPARCFEWFLGMLAAEAYFGNVKLPRWTRSGLLAALLVLVVGGIQREPLIGGLSLNGKAFYLTDVLFDPLVGVAFFLLVNWAVAGERLRRSRFGARRALRFAAFLGLFSYSIYLVHLTVIQLWDEYVGTPNNLVIVLEGVVAVTCAWVFFQLVERHFLFRR